MNSNTTTVSQSTAATSVAGAVVGVFVWLLSLIKVDVPPDVVVFFLVIAGAICHIIAVRFNLVPSSPVEATVAPPEVVAKNAGLPAAAYVAPAPMAPIEAHLAQPLSEIGKAP